MAGFYAAEAAAAFFTLAVVKGMRVEASGVCRAFETVDLWNTLIPVARDLSGAAGSARCRVASGRR